MNRLRGFLGWRVGESAPFALTGGSNMAVGLSENRPYQVVFGIGFFFFAAIYFLRPVKLYLNRPLLEAIKGSREFAAAARMGSDRLVVALASVFFACTAAYLGHQLLQLALKGH